MPKRSIRHRIGSITAAAWIGEMTSAISGTETKPTPPPKPPFEMPAVNTAGTAAA